jgi:hypothetical protein
MLFSFGIGGLQNAHRNSCFSYEDGKAPGEVIPQGYAATFSCLRIASTAFLIASRAI